MTRLKPLEVYKQMYRMGPRRSGRTVGNIIAATNSYGYFGKKSTIVVAQHALVDNTYREMKDTLRIPTSLQPNVVTLDKVTDHHGPFFPDHYTTERVIGSFQLALVQAEDEIAQLKRTLQDYEGRFV
jgi:hypothetical protein